MSAGDVAQVKVLIVSYLRAASKAAAAFMPADVPDDFDMRAEGVIDSLGFIQLITDLEQQLGFLITFENLDPEQLTTLGPLSRHIAGMADHTR